MRILAWHVHGGWMNAFVRGEHDYLLPVGPGSIGRGDRDWPASVTDVPEHELAEREVDLVVLQRTEEFELAERLLGRRLGTEVPAVFVEHNTPKPAAVTQRHPLAGRSDIELVHVTHFNRLMWDNGQAPTTVIEHGIPDPGRRYSGELERIGAVINEPVRRWRVTGTDLLPRFSTAAPIDVYGMGADGLAEALDVPEHAVVAAGDEPTERLYDALARRRLYLHTPRWTSLGLSLLEAMHLGMPVVALLATEAARAVPPAAGFLSTDVDQLVAAARMLLADPDAARQIGERGRVAALERYNLPRFLGDWDRLFERVVTDHAPHQRSTIVN